MANNSLGGDVGQLLLTQLDMLLDAVAEAAATSCDVAGDSPLASVERETFQSVVFHLAADYLNDVAVDGLHETVVVTTVGHRHQNLRHTRLFNRSFSPVTPG